MGPAVPSSGQSKDLREGFASAADLFQIQCNNAASRGDCSAFQNRIGKEGTQPAIPFTAPEHSLLQELVEASVKKKKPWPILRGSRSRSKLAQNLEPHCLCSCRGNCTCVCDSVFRALLDSMFRGPGATSHKSSVAESRNLTKVHQSYIMHGGRISSFLRDLGSTWTRLGRATETCTIWLSCPLSNILHQTPPIITVQIPLESPVRKAEGDMARQS